MKGSNVLPDVNLLLAYGWRSHASHAESREWFANLPQFVTCAITELGFLRVSISPGYRAGYQDALRILSELKKKPSASFIDCDVSATAMQPVSSHKDVTDAYLVELARQNHCRIATLDEALLRSPWAKGLVFHPFKA